MAAYLMAIVRMSDYESYSREYAPHAYPILEKHGGKLLASNENTQVLEGTLPEGRIVIVEFPSLEKANAFYNDPDYQPLIKVRQKYCESDTVIFENGLGQN